MSGLSFICMGIASWKISEYERFYDGKQYQQIGVSIAGSNITTPVAAVLTTADVLYNDTPFSVSENREIEFIDIDSALSKQHNPNIAIPPKIDKQGSSKSLQAAQSGHSGGGSVHSVSSYYVNRQSSVQSGTQLIPMSPTGSGASPCSQRSRTLGGPMDLQRMFFYFVSIHIHFEKKQKIKQNHKKHTHKHKSLAKKITIQIV